MLSLAIVDAKHAKPGTQVTLFWGEEDGGTTKPTVERHKQVEDSREGRPGAVRRHGANRVPAEVSRSNRGSPVLRRARTGFFVPLILRQAHRGAAQIVDSVA